MNVARADSVFLLSASGDARNKAQVNGKDSKHTHRIAHKLLQVMFTGEG